MNEPKMTDDHPLYYQKGKEREVLNSWRGRRFGMLGITGLFLCSAAYLGSWYYQHREKFNWIDPLPLPVIYALALLSFSFVAGIIYQALYFRCPRCQHFTGFEVGPVALTGDIFRKDSFYCYNCRVRLR